ncbi:MAG: hypothetical protein QOG97_2683 [Acidimicrobiaceae bacterium]|nr:hypothetical protein [Acidimicrobiaceae bacterium]
MARREPGADPMGSLGVLDAPQAVVQRGETDPGDGRLTLGPLMAIRPQPQRIRRVRTELQECRSPHSTLNLSRAAGSLAV